MVSRFYHFQSSRSITNERVCICYSCILVFSCIYLNRRSSTAIPQTIFLWIKLDAMAEGKLGPCMQCVRVMLLVFIAFFWVSYNVFRFTAFRINNVYYIDLEALCQLMHTYLL